METNYKMIQMLELTDRDFRAAIRNLPNVVKENMLVMNQKTDYFPKKNKYYSPKKGPNEISRTKK